MAMKAVYVSQEEIALWGQFSEAAAEAGLSVSALLLALIRAYLDGKITVTRSAIEVTSAADAT